MRVRWLFLVVVALCAVGPSPLGAQADESMTVAWVACPIVKVVKREGNVYDVLTLRGSLDGVVLGWRGVVRAVRSGEDKDLNVQDLGRAEVTRVVEKGALVRVTLEQPEGDRVVKVGDVAELRCRVPRRERSLLWKFACMNIRLRGVAKDRVYYTFRQLAREEAPELVDRLMTAMLERIRKSGRDHGDQPKLQAVLEKGRYEGRKPADLLVNATREELQTFFRFVSDYPGKYYGHVWRVDEIYATWLINAAPYSAPELAESLVAAATPEARAKIVGVAPDLRDAARKKLLGLAEGEAAAGRFERAAKALAAAREMTPMEANSPEQRAWLVSLGYVQIQQRKYREALATYQACRELCRAANPRDGAAVRREATAAHNQGSAHESLGEYPAAYACYREAEKLREKGKSSAYLRGHTRRVVGDLLRKQGRLIDAVGYYEAAAADFKTLDARDGLTDALSGRAKALATMGRNRDAARAYEELRGEHHRVGDLRREASTLVDIGSQRWTLGDYAGASRAYAEALKIREGLKDAGGIANCRDNLARLAENLGRFEEAEELYRKALESYRTLASTRNAAEVLTKLGTLAWRRGEHAEGMAMLCQARSEHASVGDRRGEIAVEAAIAELHQVRNEFRDARAALGRAIDAARKMEAQTTLSGLLHRRALLGIQLKDYERSARDLREMLAIAEVTREGAAQAEAHLALAQLDWARRDFEAAREQTETARRVARGIESRLLEAEAVRQIGKLWGAEYRADRALAAFEEARAIYASETLNAPAKLAQVGMDIAVQRHERGDWNGARAAADQALRIASKLNAGAIRHEALLAIGRMHRLRGEYAEARARYEAALKLLPGQDWARAAAVLDLAVLDDDVGRAGEALRRAAEALRLYRAMKNEWGEAYTHAEMARIRLRRGDTAAAAGSIAAARRLAEPLGDFGMLTAVEKTAGRIEEAREKFAEARKRFAKAVDYARRSGSEARELEVLLLSARVLRKLGDCDAAEKALIRARDRFHDLGARFHEAEARIGLAALHLDRGRREAATASLAAAAPLVHVVGSPHQAWRLHDLESRAAPDLDRALDRKRRAIAVLDRLRAGLGGEAAAQRRFLRSKIRVYESMAELLGRKIDEESDAERRKAHLSEALAFLARARFEVLREGSGGGGRSGSPAVDALLEKIEAARRQIARLEKVLEEARRKGNRALADQLTKELASNEEALAELHDNLAAADPDFAARIKFNPAYFEGWESLPKKGRLIIYFPGEERLYIWVYGPEGFLTWKQHRIGRKALHAKVAVFRELIDEVIREVKTSQGRGFGPAAEANEENPAWYRENCRKMRGLLRELHGHLIAPVAEELADADPLLILPYGLLSYLPFEALLDRHGAFLGESRRLAYFVHKDHMSRTLNRLGRPPRRGEDHWVAFADPVGKLASALEEVAEIQALFPNHNVHTQETGDATEAQLLATPEACTILHFATHGYLNGLRPADTYLELAPSPPHDGKLMQKEVWPRFRTKLPCIRKRNLRLVVLSACETARAANAPEAEVLGLPDKFAAVGAPAVVASLWSVYTWSTTDLMVEFYGKLKDNGSDVGGALRDARRALLADKDHGRYAHPYYWAPFLLFGDWR